MIEALVRVRKADRATIFVAEERQLFVVRAEVDYNNVSIVNLRFLSGAKFSGMAFMRHE